MTKEQAVDILTKATAELNATRQTHELILQALKKVQSLQEQIVPPKPLEG